MRSHVCGKHPAQQVVGNYIVSRTNDSIVVAAWKSGLLFACPNVTSSTRIIGGAILIDHDDDVFGIWHFATPYDMSINDER